MRTKHFTIWVVYILFNMTACSFHQKDYMSGSHDSGYGSAQGRRSSKSKTKNKTVEIAKKTYKLVQTPQAESTPSDSEKECLLEDPEQNRTEQNRTEQLKKKKRRKSQTHAVKPGNG